MLNISKLNKKLNSIYYNNTCLKMLFKNHVSSTNDYIKYKYARDLFPLVIVANTQRAARGRNKKTWLSLNQKSISFSLCFKINAQDFDLRRLSYVSCISLLNVIKKNTSNKNIKIKWPNDLYLDNKKVSGILIESLSTNKEVYVGIGVGINLDIPNNSYIDRPFSNLGMIEDASLIIALFCESLFKNIIEINLDKIIKIYNTNLIWHQKKVCISDYESACEGRLLGINEHGELTIESDGNIKYINNIDSTMRLV